MSKLSVVAAVLWMSLTPARAVELKGAVVDAAGKPVGGATVWLCQDLDVKEVAADDSGAFAFADVRAEAAVVAATKQGFSLGGADVPAPGLGPVVVALGPAAALRVSTKDEFFEPLAGVRVTHIALNGLLTIPAEVLSEKSSFPSIVSDDTGRHSARR